MSKTKAIRIALCVVFASDMIYKLMSISKDRDIIKAIKILAKDNDDLRDRIKKLEEVTNGTD